MRGGESRHKEKRHAGENDCIFTGVMVIYCGDCGRSADMACTGHAQEAEKGQTGQKSGKPEGFLKKLSVHIKNVVAGKRIKDEYY